MRILRICKEELDPYYEAPVVLKSLSNQMVVKYEKLARLFYLSLLNSSIDSTEMTVCLLLIDYGLPVNNKGHDSCLRLKF